ncbi:hypothetical protein ATANTOWER_013454 [Ataeniobius toweri]|uniref:Secreted protein n=1 Tax=Ataeniobius toweri TaxID=208326 RepID=A0ABU7AAK1_9TELE|nr:hypothetical protein [Ataeniobius toweri]
MTPIFLFYAFAFGFEVCSSDFKKSHFLRGAPERSRRSIRCGRQVGGDPAHLRKIKQRSREDVHPVSTSTPSGWSVRRITELTHCSSFREGESVRRRKVKRSAPPNTDTELTCRACC